MSQKKISVIGAGNIGGTLAYLCSIRGFCDVVLVDVIEGIPQGKALDIAESTPLRGGSINFTGSNEYTKIMDSDIVIITAGLARKPGMSRDDLLKINAGIVKSVSENIKKYAPNSIVIVVSNPLDAMVYVAYKILGFPAKRVIGMAGVLDTTRFCYFVATELGVSVENVSAMVLGGHGDQMIPLTRFANVASIPLNELMSKEKISQIVDRTRNGGIEIVDLLKTGSAYYAPASSIMAMIESIILDKKKILPCAAYLDGQYGANGVFIGVPVKLGKEGVEQVFELKLNEQEQGSFLANVKHVKQLISKLDL
jgi:malate dehydrogenase